VAAEAVVSAVGFNAEAAESAETAERKRNRIAEIKKEAEPSCFFFFISIRAFLCVLCALGGLCVKTKAHRLR
jgi:hypothetical protein